MMAAIGVAAILVCAGARADDPIAWSPDRKLYAVHAPGQPAGNGREGERLVIYTDAGERVAVVRVSEAQPQAAMRGCDRWGWVDPARVFCEGSTSPSLGVYLVFDARSGRKLQELVGTDFVWSLDRSRVANLGAVRGESNSLEIDSKQAYPPEKDTAQHWFRSRITWSPDSRRVAVVDQRPEQGSVYLVIVGPTGASFEHKLHWQGLAADWPPEPDFWVHWSGNQVVVEHAGASEPVSIAP